MPAKKTITNKNLDKKRTTITRDDSQEWANTRLVARATLVNRVHELNSNGKVYILHRSFKESARLNLIAVIDEPSQGLKCRICDNSDV